MFETNVWNLNNFYRVKFESQKYILYNDRNPYTLDRKHHTYLFYFNNIPSK